jgi:hypothetical protein
VYPVSDTVPANTLFFHVRFSSQMMQDINAWQYVSILDARGSKIDQTWRQHSFWLDSGRLLVLMVHPGRVKTGIHYIGPVFEPGKRYTLRTEAGLKDVTGNPLKAQISKEYFIGEEDRTLPKIVNIQQSQPDKTSVAISITFSEGMDYASMIEGIKLSDEEGLGIPVKVGQITNDRTFLLAAYEPLPKGRYSVQFKSSITDFAGNRLNRSFEITSLEEKLTDTIQVYRTIDIQ